MTVYFRSPALVITERLIRVRVPLGWQVWVISDLRDFGICRRPSPATRRSWLLGGSALVLAVLTVRPHPRLLPIALLLLVAACVWYVIDRRAARRRASSQLWATRRGASIMVFERPDREFDAACRALRRVLQTMQDGHS